MMKMDVRDSTECQNWENKDINVIFGKFNEVNETRKIVPSSSKGGGPKT